MKSIFCGLVALGAAVGLVCFLRFHHDNNSARGGSVLVHDDPTQGLTEVIDLAEASPQCGMTDLPDGHWTDASTSCGPAAMHCRVDGRCLVLEFPLQEYWVPLTVVVHVGRVHGSLDVECFDTNERSVWSIQSPIHLPQDAFWTLDWEGVDVGVLSHLKVCADGTFSVTELVGCRVDAPMDAKQLLASNFFGRAVTAEEVNSASPSFAPSFAPSTSPSMAPSSMPSSAPSAVPSFSATVVTEIPGIVPTHPPTETKIFLPIVPTFSPTTRQPCEGKMNGGGKMNSDVGKMSCDSGKMAGKAGKMNADGGKMSGGGTGKMNGDGGKMGSSDGGKTTGKMNGGTGKMSGKAKVAKLR